MTSRIFAPVLLACFTWAAPSAERKLPNIILLLADDLGYGELGCQGNPEIPTPHIDSLARNGVRFTQGYVTAAFCSASRAGLMTGRYQTRFGYEYNPTGAKNEDPNAGLPTREKTIADLLVSAGYITGLVGKWHLGGTAKYNPIRRGFDEFFGFMHEGHYFVPPPYHGTTTWLRRKVLPGGGSGRWISADQKLIFTTHMGNTEPDYDADNPIYRAGQPVEEREYLTDAFTREAVDFIDRNADKPFFLYLAYNAVHSPLQGTDKYMQKFAHIEDIQRRIFAAMLANMDESVGDVLKKLREKKLERDTLIFFLSDNGGPTRELTSSNLPLRDGKGSVYEGGLRVPFIAQWKGRLPGKTTYENPILSPDIFATACALADVTLDRKKKYDGVNLIPYLTGKKTGRPHDKLFWRIGNRAAIRSGDWKLLRNPRRGQGNDWELYNLSKDIGETKNLATTEPEIASRLRHEWEELNGDMIDPVWDPRRK
ncbi:MAG: N-acetylgalactosamine-4-sulfatase [Verrucomicrobiales bacterium]|nr:N-acetylgalactosamine-4-sulfatase [Verrucomicrobiales bacterium]|tara:strand:- start:3794 stop:5239 length:1446 start_codon:yes stop_codon:yes gene_type:complete